MLLNTLTNRITKLFFFWDILLLNNTISTLSTIFKIEFSDIGSYYIQSDKMINDKKKFYDHFQNIQIHEIHISKHSYIGNSHYYYKVFSMDIKLT